MTILCKIFTAIFKTHICNKQTTEDCLLISGHVLNHNMNNVCISEKHVYNKSLKKTTKPIAKPSVLIHAKITIFNQLNVMMLHHEF